MGITCVMPFLLKIVHYWYKLTTFVGYLLEINNQQKIK